MRNRDLQAESIKIQNFIKKQLRNAGKDKIIIGLSGGIDSSLSATLAVNAIGKENVIGVMLPYRTSHPDSLNHAKLVAEHLGIETTTIDISPMVDAYFDTYEKDADRLRIGNRKARERMCVLYDYSSKYNGLVLGTGNKTELMIGYFTQYGDGACAFEPLGHIYKTEVWDMSRLLGVPEVIIDKKPTADLWDDQTDEGELGITYKNLDELLYRIYEIDTTLTELMDSGFSHDDIIKVKSLVDRSDFKRKLPPVLEEIEA